MTPGARQQILLWDGEVTREVVFAGGVGVGGTAALSNSNLSPQRCHACLGHIKDSADVSIVLVEVSYMTARLIACHA